MRTSRTKWLSPNANSKNGRSDKKKSQKKTRETQERNVPEGLKRKSLRNKSNWRCHKRTVIKLGNERKDKKLKNEKAQRGAHKRRATRSVLRVPVWVVEKSTWMLPYSVTYPSVREARQEADLFHVKDTVRSPNKKCATKGLHEDFKEKHTGGETAKLGKHRDAKAEVL